MPTQRNVRTTVLLACGIAAGLAATGLAVAGATGPHGAASSEDQIAALRPLLPGDPAATPASVDPAAWKALVPAGNETTPARVELGRRLYFDMRLSADGTVSCATCHDVTRSFTDRRAVSEGIRDQNGKRNAPTTMNAALLHTQFWDGRAATLEDQAVLPIVNPVEMGMPDGQAAVAAIADDPEYRRLFREAYGTGITYEGIGRAIAVFERTLIFLDAPADRHLRGVAGAIGADAKRGLILYNGKARCVACHPLTPVSPLGTDQRFHNIGVSARKQDFELLAKRALAEIAKDPSLAKLEELALATDLSELGRFLVSRNYADVGSFRTPQVRNAGITAPYMHDGSMESLWDVVDHYNRGGEENPYLDGGIEPLALSEAEIDDLVAFLFTLTDDRFADLNAAERKRQQELSRRERPFRDDAIANRRRIPFDPRD